MRVHQRDRQAERLASRVVNFVLKECERVLDIAGVVIGDPPSIVTQGGVAPRIGRIPLGEAVAFDVVPECSEATTNPAFFATK